MKKSTKLIIISLTLILIVGVVIYSNQTFGYFILSSPALDKTYVSLRFDDGLKSQLPALHLLVEKNLTGSVYIISSKPNSSIDWEEKYYLNWDEIKNISQFVEIGSHTQTHANLIYSKNVEKEIVESKKEIESQGINVSTFVYPGGNYNSRVINLVEKTYNCASTQDVGTNALPIRPVLLKDFTFRSTSDSDTIKRVIKEGKWNILTFHDIGKINSSEVQGLYYNVASQNAVNLEFFEEVLEYIKSNNITIISINEGCELFKNAK